MESKVKFAGHPVHPMLIVFPLGLLATAVIFDIIYLVSSNSQWTVVAYYMIGAGIIGGLAAAAFGWLDWIAIPTGTRARRIGLWHGIGNVVVVGLFILSWVLRGRIHRCHPREQSSLGLPGWSSRWQRPGWVASWWIVWVWEWMTEHTWTRPAPYPNCRPVRGSAAHLGLPAPVLRSGAGQPRLRDNASLSARLIRLIACSRRSACPRSSACSRYTRTTGNLERV